MPKSATCCSPERGHRALSPCPRRVQADGIWGPGCTALLGGRGRGGDLGTTVVLERGRCLHNSPTSVFNPLNPPPRHSLVFQKLLPQAGKTQ